jgi:3-(3-hydroxy-phenyl)propionate hydroxylase
MTSGLDIHYEFGEGHPLLGRRMPDLDVDTASDPGSSPCCTMPGRCSTTSVSPAVLTSRGGGRIQLVDAQYDGAWELPVLGVVTAPTAVLIRPDGYVAWVGDLTQRGLTDAMTSWFGTRAAA